MADLGLFSFKSAGELVAEQQAEELRLQEDARKRVFESSLAAHIRRCWESAKQAKQPVEQRMLDCLRRRKGEYDAEKLAAITQQGGSAIYMMLTATKCRAAAAWLREILMPTNERPWGLDPTPLPDVPLEYIQAFGQRLQAQLQQAAGQGGQVEMPSRERIKEIILREVQKRARTAADAMEEVIADQLAEGGWDEAFESFLDDFVTFPAAVLRAPVLRRVPSFKWTEGWNLVETQEVRPEFERVAPFDLYPSPDAVTIDDGAYLLERVRYTRAQLNQLRGGVPGYSDEALEAVLRDYGQGGLRDWLWTDGERASLEGRRDALLSPAETIDGLLYHGSAQGVSLLQWGMPAEAVEDPLGEYEVEAILVGRHVIRAVINRDPLGRRPYHKASFQPVPGSFWGQSIPELMADIQDTCNAAARAMINNMAVASGPQIEVNWDRLQPEEDGRPFPWKVWRTKSSMVSNNDPAIRFFQPSSNIAELMALYEKFEQKADDATNVPRYLYGNERVGGAGNTASGLSMLMESANKGIRDAIRHVDRGVLRRVIEAMWLFNMRYSDDSTIKGDCRAVARGSNAMLNRERTQVLRQEALQLALNSPLVQQILGPEKVAALLRSVFDRLDMPDLVPDDEQVKQQLEQQNAANAQTQQIQQQMAEIEAALKQAKAQDAQADTEKTRAETALLMLQVERLMTLIGGMNAVQRPAGPGFGAPGAGSDPRLAGVPGPAGAGAGHPQGQPGFLR